MSQFEIRVSTQGGPGESADTTPRPVSRQIRCVQKAAGLIHVTTTTLRSGEEATSSPNPLLPFLELPAQVYDG
jgi:hypothetical protein